MAGKLIGRFLHWLRQEQRPTDGTEQPPHTTQQIAPPVEKQPANPSRQASSDILSLVKQPHLRSAKNPERSASVPPPSPTRSTVEPSNFSELLNDHRYSPNSAVQSLSYQLSHPQSQTTVTEDLPLSENPLSLETGVIRDLPETSQSAQAHRQQIPQNKGPQPPQPDGLDIADIPQPSSIAGSTESRPSPTTDKSIRPAEPIPQPALPHIPQSSTTVTKQGVVKLLFKIKKNNHHGYITPNDGSKDIIFHQKYIDNDVFCRLERGMAVEVTAHVTEGKAYADHVRIL